MTESQENRLNKTIAEANAILSNGDGERPTVNALAEFASSEDCPPGVHDAVVERLRIITGWDDLESPVSITNDAEVSCVSTKAPAAEACWTIPALNDMFCDVLGAQEQIKWPLAPLVTAWQDRPIRVAVDRRNTGILPHSCQYTASTAGDFPQDVLSTVDTHSGQVTLPPQAACLLDLSPSDQMPAPPSLLMYDFSGLPNHIGGRGAPLPLRLWHEMVMAVPMDQRGHVVSRVSLPIRELIAWLWPHGGFRPSKHWDGLQKSLAALNRMYVPFQNDLWAIVLVRRMPRDPKGVISVDISIPPGTGHGPLIHRGTLRQYGLQNVGKYRAYLWICFMWDRYGRTPTGTVQATRPAVARDEEGFILDVDGQRVLNRGKPVTDWNHRSAVPLLHREPNPAAARRYPVLSDAQLVHLVNPAARQSHNERRQKRDARKIIDALAHDGVVILDRVKTQDGRDGLRIYPPKGWGPNWREEKAV